jgi:flagellar biosynthesis/type III secretory pathway chaperone
MFSTSTKKTLTQKTVVKRLQSTVVPLVAAIKAENALLENGKLSKLQEVCEQKVQCLQNLSDAEMDLEDFLKNTPLDKSDPFLLKLREAFLELGEVNERNDILLRANIEASSKIMEFYKEAHKNKITKSYGYNSQGNIVVSKNLEKIMPSISLNNKV